MAATTISPRYVFGFRGDVKDNVAYSDDGSVVYPAGHNIVLYSSETKTQRLIPGTLESEGITAMCMSGNRRMFAVAERSDKAMITVYDLQTLKRRKQLVASDAGSKVGDVQPGRQRAGDGGGAVHPEDVPPAGRRPQGGEPVAGQARPGDVVCQGWVQFRSLDSRERSLLGTSEGEVLMMESTELRAAFSCENGLGVESLACYSKGFVAGQGGGVVTIFERDDKEAYRRARAFTIEEQRRQGQAEDMNFEALGCNNHSAAVTGLDICVRKPLIVSCSSDRTVRLWNYQERTCELTKAFADDIHAVAMHPNGLQVLVGFADKLRLMSVLMDDLKLVRELAIKGCRECCFSSGGQYFAAVNGTTISIYNTHTCENLGNLRGHNGKVRSLHWSPDDSKIVSAGMDGAVYEWRLRDFKRDKEHVLKGCSYSSVLATPDCKTLYACGSDRKIKEFEDSMGAGTQITKEVDAGGSLTQLSLLPQAKIMCAATDTGSIRTYKFPLSGEFQEVKCHNGAVTRMKATWDEQLLVTAGEDGSVAVFDVRDKDAKAAARREQERVEYAVEVLVTRTELDEKRTRMSELEQQVAELTMQNEYQLRLKDLHLQEKLKELTEKCSAELEVDRQKFELLLGEKNEQEMEYEDKLKQAEERSQTQLGTLDAQYQSKVMAEVERYQLLLSEKELLNTRWDEQNSLLVDSHERVIAELTEDYEAKLSEEALKLEALQQDKSELEREFDEIKRQLEEDADREIEDMKDKYDQKLQTEREASLRLKGENGIMRKKFNALQKDIEGQREEIKSLFEQKKELYSSIASLEKDISSLKREIRERDETIGDKERRIYDLKKKNQELEKFKFVLDYKIKELKKQIEPREDEISDMKEQIKEMDGELERYHKTNATLDLSISSLKLKQTGLQAEVLGQRSGKQDAFQMLTRIQHDLQEVAQWVQEPKVLKEKVKALFQRHCGEAGITVEEDGDVEREGSRQREYLERSVDSLKRKLAKDSELHRTDNLRVMQENTALIKEINELRREIKAQKTKGLPGSGGVIGGGGGGNSTGGGAKGGASAADLSTDLKRELDIQRELISRLREDSASKEARIRSLEAMVVPRPMSRERLPPMEGFSSSHD
ncbi:MAG: hypothetical protein WDW38_010360 [Sanguina aurantia]